MTRALTPLTAFKAQTDPIVTAQNVRFGNGAPPQVQET